MPAPIVMDDYNSDWDLLYPYSSVSFLYIYHFSLVDSFVNDHQFLSPYKLLLDLDPSYVSPWTNGKSFAITSINHDENLIPGTRNITVQVSHPELIWTGKKKKDSII